MRVERVEQPGQEWDAFAGSMPGATLGHAAAWARVVREAYGLEPHYLAARGAGADLAGILPLARFRSLRGRRELVSLPFLDTAGILARTPEAEEALLEAALRLSRELRCQALELRQLEPLAARPAELEARRVDLVLALEGDEEAQWKALRAKVRNQTRKAERAGLEIGSGDPEELLRDFYTPFCVNMRDLGSPVHAAEFFRSAARSFGPRLRFIVTHLAGRPVGGLVAIHYAGVVTVPWASTLRSARQHCPNNLIYWEALRWSVAQGAREFDFGRSPPESGTYRFKVGWGAVERPLAWMRLTPEGQPLAPAPSGEGATLARLSSLWTRLPLGVASLVGPRIRRFLSN